MAQMLGNDVKVSENGEVTGTIKHLTGVTAYEQEEQQEGHYFPMRFEEKNFKPLHVGGKVVGDDFAAGKDITPSEKDPYLVIRVENCTDGNKVTVYDKESKAELFTLDFSKATLEKKPTKIKTSAKTPVMSAPEPQEEGLSVTDDENTYEQENGVEKRYTKSEINRMSTADLQSLAIEKGIDGAYDMTGSDLKTLLIEMLVN